MSKIFRLLTTLTVIAALLIGPSIGAAAPTNPIDNGNETATTTAPPDDRMARTLSPATYIESWDYDHDAGTWKITINSEISTTLTVSEAVPMDESGSARFAIRQYQLERGTTTIEFHAPPIDGMSKVSLTTTESIAAGNGVYLQSGSRSVDRAPVPFDTAAIFVGAAALGGAGLAFAFTKRQWEDDDDEERRERIA